MSDLSKRLKRFKDYPLVDLIKMRKLGDKVFIVNKQPDFVLPLYKSLRTPKIDVLYVQLAKTFSKSAVYKIIKSYEDIIKFAQYGYNHIDVYYALEESERVAYCNSINKYLPILYKEINKYFKGIVENLNPVVPLQEFTNVAKGKESAETFLRVYIKQYMFLENISQAVKSEDFEKLSVFNKEFLNSHNIVSLSNIVLAGRFFALKEIEQFVKSVENETNIIKCIINYGELIVLYKSCVLKAVMNRADLLFMKFGAQSKNNLLICLFAYHYERLSLQMSGQAVKDIENYFPSLSKKLVSLITVNEENNIIFYEKLENIFEKMLSNGIEMEDFDKCKLFDISNKTEIESLLKEKIEDFIVSIKENKYDTKTNFFEQKMKIDVNDSTNSMYKLINKVKKFDIESLQEIMYNVIVNKHIEYKYCSFDTLEKEFGIDRVYYMSKFTTEMYKVALTIGFAKIKKFIEFEFNDDKLNKLINEAKKSKEKEENEEAVVLENRKKMLNDASNVIKKEIFDKAKFIPLEKIICNDELFLNTEFNHQTFDISEVDYEEEYLQIITEESAVIESIKLVNDLTDEEINRENIESEEEDDLNESEEIEKQLMKDTLDVSEFLSPNEESDDKFEEGRVDKNNNKLDSNYNESNKFITLKINKKYCVIKKEKKLNKKD